MQARRFSCCYLCSCDVHMGGRKFSLGVRRKRRKYHERITFALKISIPIKCSVHLPPLSLAVSLPSATYFDAPAPNADVLSKRMTSFPFPPTWVSNALEVPITLCKLRTYQQPSNCPRVDVLLTLSIYQRVEMGRRIPSVQVEPN